MFINKNNGSRKDREERNYRAEQRKLNLQLFMQDVNYNLKNSSFQRKCIAFGKFLLLLFILAGIPIIMLITMRHSILSTEYWADLPERLGSHRVLSFIILMLLQTAQIVICVLPGQPIQMTASYLYGIGGGYIISILGSILGAIITYYLANFLGSEALHLVFGEERVKDYMRKLNSSKAYFVIFMIYLIPVIPKDLMSYVAGISDIKLKPFLLFSTLGRTPPLLASLLIGTFLKQKNYVGIGIAVVIVAAIMALCLWKKDAIMAKLSSYEDEESES